MEGLYKEMIREQYEENNNKILYRVRNNDQSLTLIKVAAGCPTNDAERDIYFSLLSSDNWKGLDELGKCIGSTTHLTHMKLHMDLRGDMPDEDDVPHQALPENDPRMKQTVLFCKGLATNTSIQSIHLNVLGGNIFGLLNPFFKNNPKLHELVIDDCHYYQFWDGLISALRDCVSLKHVKINHMELMGEESGEIFQTLRIHQPQLEVLEFPGNQLSRRSCEGEEALTNLLRDSNQLHTLDISRNSLSDDALQGGLLPYLGKLRCLNMSWNLLTITWEFDGWQALATLLKDPTCNLEELTLNGNQILGKRLRSFARALAKNKKLKILDLTNNVIAAAGWDAFSDVLCDTSSINNTYNSNHTLRQLIKEDTSIENRDTLPGHIEQFLTLNKQHDDKKKVAAIKIMQYHWRNITMLPFFEWELKCLPVAVNWFDNVPSFPRPRCEIEMSKLQSIYEFVRDMPVETADGYFGRNKKVSKKRARS